ncbi:hypothetical protein F5B18DRAFT_605401 [Nemania serpens]|nr:hypothetical protein F5B18DRAFT_605401 [Nemania serpens]
MMANQAKLEALVVQLSQRVTDLEVQLATLQTTVQANDFNARMRLRNSHSTRRSDRLEPLRAPATNELIEDFPESIVAIDRMAEDRINRLFVMLGQRAEGTLEEKRRQLERLVGVIYGGRYVQTGHNEAYRVSRT